MNEGLLKEKYVEQVEIPLKKELEGRNQPYFDLLFENEKSLFVFFGKEPFCMMFLDYVPEGEQTSLTSVVDSINRIATGERVSKGEWGVRKIYEVDTDLYTFFKEDLLELMMPEPASTFALGNTTITYVVSTTRSHQFIRLPKTEQSSLM